MMAELKKVTITGADDNSDIFKMIELSKKYPFVEWGILVSRSSAGHLRFPTDSWIRELISAQSDNINISLSMHICGAILWELMCHGDWNSLGSLQTFLPAFSRIQLNFHGEESNWEQSFYDALLEQKQQIIMQMDGINDHFYSYGLQRKKINCVPFFDTSHGAGVLPDKWPGSIGDYCGYAGGLSPDNVIGELYKIRRAAGESNFWIDTETGVRTDGELDFEKVDKFLERSEAFIPDHF